MKNKGLSGTADIRHQLTVNAIAWHANNRFRKQKSNLWALCETKSMTTISRYIVPDVTFCTPEFIHSPDVFIEVCRTGTVKTNIKKMEQAILQDKGLIECFVYDYEKQICNRLKIVKYAIEIKISKRCHFGFDLKFNL